MSRATFFIQECPTCGRRVQIRVEYLGRVVQCLHCEGRFEALDATGRGASEPMCGFSVLDRANELLESAEVYRPRPR